MKSGDVRADVVKLWAPPPRQTVCEWAQEHFIVTTGANKGSFRPAPYQIEPINAIMIMSATQMLRYHCVFEGSKRTLTMGSAIRHRLGSQDSGYSSRLRSVANRAVVKTMLQQASWRSLS